MTTVAFCVGWLLLLGLLLCTSRVVERALGLKPCFAPIVTVCAITSVLFYAGLLGWLRPVTWVVYTLCAVCVVLQVRHWRKNPFVLRELPVIPGLFALGALAFFWVLAHGSLVHYDNFTHWAVVVKEILLTHAFPTPDSAMVEFANYPTGTATWIYFVCTLVGHGENSMVMAQGLVIFAGLYAVFGIIQQRGRFLLIAILGTGLSLLSLFNFSIRINNLLVDFVLPVLTLAAIALVYRHRREMKTACIATIPILGMLVVVKSTGVIFAAIALSYLVYCLVVALGTGGQKRLALWGTVSLGLSLLPLLGWNLRMATVFAGVTNKFETDLSVVGSGGKSPAEIQQICTLFWDTITDLSQRATMGVVLFQGLAMVACIIGCFVLKKRWALPKVLLAMDVVLIGYLAGILAMYIFSMPMDEAVYLAAFDRYASSIVVLFGGVLTMCFTCDVERSFYYRLGDVDEMRSFQSFETKTLYLRSCVACVIVLTLVLTSEYNGMVYQEAVDKASVSHKVKDVVGDSWSPEVDDSRYLMFASDRYGLVTNYYIHYVAQYYLRAPQVDAICLFYEDNFLTLLSQYDYLVIVESSTHAQRLMERYFGLSGAPGIYDLSSLHP